MEPKIVIKEVVGVVLFADGDALPGIKSADFVMPSDFLCVVQGKLSQVVEKKGVQLIVRAIKEMPEACR